MAVLYKANVTVLHFADLNKGAVEIEKDKTDFEAYAFHLQRFFNESGITFHLLETASVSETMENLDKKKPYDILAMVRRKKSSLEKLLTKSFTQAGVNTATPPMR